MWECPYRDLGSPWPSNLHDERINDPQVPLTTLKLRVSLTTLSGHSHTEFKTCNSPPVSQNWRSPLDGRRRPVSYDTALRFTFINSQQRVMSDCFILTHYTLFWQSVSPSSAHQQHSHTKIASVQNVTTVMSSALVRWSVWSQVYIYIYLNYCKYLNQIIKDTMYPLPRGLMWSHSIVCLSNMVSFFLWCWHFLNI